jgi:hypothetical protein
MRRPTSWIQISSRPTKELAQLMRGFLADVLASRPDRLSVDRAKPDSNDEAE